MARICREAKALVKANVLLRDMNVAVNADDGRRVEVLAQGLPCRAGAQLAIDITIGTADISEDLARRLEQKIGSRGVTALETTNFVLLLVVLVTLVVEASVELSATQLGILHWVDALACLFFVGDFVFELILHPSRWSWFRRNALTDLLPAIPPLLFLLHSLLPLCASFSQSTRSTRHRSRIP